MTQYAQPVCWHCRQPFSPTCRNRNRQKFCLKAECRQASKVHSQQVWFKKNPDYFHGAQHAERMRQWRKAHPKSTSVPTYPTSTGALSQDDEMRLQDFVLRNPLVLGLVAHIVGCTSQDDIEKHARALIVRGMQFRLSISMNDMSLSPRRPPLGRTLSSEPGRTHPPIA